MNVSATSRHLRMNVVGLRTYGTRANRGGQLDRRPRIIDAESRAPEHMFVNPGVEIGEALAEFDLLAVDRDRTEGSLHSRLRHKRQVAVISRQEPLHVGVLEREVAGGAVHFA